MEGKEIYEIPSLVMFGFMITFTVLVTILLLVVVFLLFGG